MFIMLWGSDQVVSIPGFQNPFGDVISCKRFESLCFNSFWMIQDRRTTFQNLCNPCLYKMLWKVIF